MKTRLTLFSVLAVLFTAALAPVGAAKAVTIIKGPYLQQVTHDSIVIMWETDDDSDSRVDYGSNDSYGTYETDDTLVKIHEIELTTNLNPGTMYHYKVTSDGVSDTSTFTTAPGAGQSFSFVAYGDTRSDSSYSDYPDAHAAHDAVVTAITTYSKPDIVIHTGDLVQDGSYSQWGPQFFTPAHSLMTNTAMFPVMGNHEGDGTEFRNFFSLPDNEQWYSFTYGCVQFIALDTTSTYSSGSQHSWLVSELESSDSAWLIVYFHHPPYTSCSGHSDDTNVQQDLVPLFEQYGVDMVFSGHSHVYERYCHNGIYYIVTGGGGAPLHSLQNDDRRQAGESIYHHCVIDVGSTSLTLLARDNDGFEFDTITIEKTAKASNPNPEDEAENVPADTVLSWRAGIGAVSHDVYFGTNTNPDTLVSEMQTETTYDPGTLAPLAPGITYYWKVDERNSSGGIAPGVVWSFTTEATLPWSDGFESGSFSAAGWSTSSQATVVSSAADTGNYGALLKKTAWIEKAVSTVGYDSIYVNYARKTKGLDTDEYLLVEWYDGSTWHELEETQDSSWSSVEMTCTLEDDNIEAGNNANFKIRFSTNGNAGNDEAMVDDVEITNIPPAPDNTPPEPDPLTWNSPPSATGPTSISMTATTASDPSGVEYYFVCTDGGGNDSGWQDIPTYEDTGLSPGTTYTYQVKAQDKIAIPNVNIFWSTEESATTTEAGTTMHVESIDVSLLQTGKNWKAVAEIVISPTQAGATVVGDWYLYLNGSGSVIQTGATGVTDGVGYTKITSPPKKATSGDTFKFVVTDVVLSGCVYDPGQGVTEGSDTVQ